MILPIVRIYDSATLAGEAVTRLLDAGLDSSQVNLVTPDTAATEETIAAAIASGMVLMAHAKQYAKAIKAGHSLVSVNAPFGTGRRYTEVMESCRPVAKGLDEEVAMAGWDEATPFSCAFGLPVLLPPSRYSFLGLPSLSRNGATTSASLGLAELASPDFMLFGTPKLSRNPAPFSSLFNLPVLR
jgi:hypothetical protein